MYQYRPKRPIKLASVGVDKTLISHASRQIAQEESSTTNQVKTVILQQC